MVYLFLEGASFIKDDSGGDVGCFITSLSESLLSWGKCPVASLAFCVRENKTMFRYKSTVKFVWIQHWVKWNLV